MTEKFEIYKCNVCGNTVQVLLAGIGELACCGQKMEHLVPHSEENNELSEKHTPMFEKSNDKKFVALNFHPMVSEHYIQFIEVFPKDKTELHLKYFTPNEEAKLETTHYGDSLEALELCNIHGLWRGQDD